MTTWANLYTYSFAAQSQYPTAAPYAAGHAVTPLASNSGYSASGTRAGGLHPIDHTQEVGSRAPLFGGDFFDRIHVFPSSIEIGNLIGTQEYTVSVWNAYYTDGTLTDAALADAEGISLAGGEAMPFNFSPRESITWMLTATQAGPPVIAATLTYDFDGELFVVPITGRRVIGFSFTPDWSASGILERLEWATDLIEAYDGQEQRRSLRQHPRRSIEFTVTVSDREKRRLEAMLFGWGSRVWAVPIWTDGATLGANVAAGSMTLDIDTATRDYQPGGFVMLASGISGNSEVGEIESVTALQISLKRPLISSWPGGTAVFPARSARLQTPPSLSRFTGDTSVGRMLFDLTDPQQWATDHGLDTYRGYPVMTFAINWITDPEFSFDRRLNILDNGSGQRLYDDETGIPLTRRTVAYTMPDRATIDVWRKTLHALKGRAGAIWSHTDGKDIEMVSPLLSAEIQLDFTRIGFVDYLADVVGRRDIRIKLKDGTIFYRRIAGYGEIDADTEYVTIDSPLGIDVLPDDIDAISFLFLARLDSDAVELSWWSGDVVDSVVTMRGFNNGV